MAIAKMKLVNIVGRLREFDSVVQQCCLEGNFHPELSSLALENVEEFIPIEESNPYERATQKTVDIAVHSDISLHYSSFDGLDMDSDALSAYIDRFEEELGALNGRVGVLSQTAARLEQVLTSLTHLKDFKINLDELFGCSYTVFRFGRLPKESYYKISDSDRDDMMFFPLEEDELFYWGFYVALKSIEDEAAEFFTSLYFERISIIEEAHGTPDEAYHGLSAQLESTRAELVKAQEAVKSYWKERLTVYLQVYSKLRYLHDAFDIRKFAARYADSFYIFGWVPEADIESFSRRFEKLPHVDCVVEDTKDAENVDPPTSLVNRKFAKPFEMFVGMYGLPIYNEIDPTPFMAVTYMLIFGIMFADLGQGALIFGIGLFLWLKKKMPLGGIMYRIGLSSMVFGVLFDDLFGHEFYPHALIPVHENENTMLVLGATIGLGILLILVCMIFNMVNGIRQKRFQKVLLSANGIPGMVFYLTVLITCVLIFTMKIGLSPLVLVFLIILPLLVIGFAEPLEALMEHKKDWIPQKKGEFGISAFFELFETLLSYVTNTISFVRVGAYILSHAGMMAAVFALAQMAPSAGNIVVQIIGNAFVMVLEGFVVAIQGIRLQYYEIFSRFYEGTGKEFAPVRIRYE